MSAMRPFLAPALAAGLALGPVVARADTAPILASYTGYIAGLPILELDAEFQFRPDGRYVVTTRFRTRGIAAAFVSGEQTSRPEGEAPQNPAAALRPLRYSMEGTWNGKARRILLDYVGATPVVRDLVPPNTDEREPVPEAQQAGTVDVLTAVAGLARAVSRTGRCEGTAATFDGRRRTDFTAVTAGTEVLAPERRGIFSGPVTTCRFEARQVGGFFKTWDREEAAKPRHGVAWIARPIAEGPPVPVRMEIENGYFGLATLHLTRIERTDGRVGASRTAN